MGKCLVVYRKNGLDPIVFKPREGESLVRWKFCEHGNHTSRVDVDFEVTGQPKRRCVCEFLANDEVSRVVEMDEPTGDRRINFTMAEWEDFVRSVAGQSHVAAEVMSYWFERKILTANVAKELP
jgi:hypothetical protein